MNIAFNERFPRSNKVLDRLTSGDAGVLKTAGLCCLLFGAVIIDFPGALMKAQKDFKLTAKKSPST